jgi:hypothetical protein
MAGGETEKNSLRAISYPSNNGRNPTEAHVKAELICCQEDNLESQLLKVKGITNTMSLGARKPCTNDCIVLSVASSIEYDDGQTADVKSGVR